MITNERLFNLSGIQVEELFGILPESYLLFIVVAGLVIVGTSNFWPGASELKKKSEITPVILDLIVNSLICVCIINIFQLFFFFEQNLINFISYSINDFYTIIIKLLVILTTILICKAGKNTLKFHPRHLIEYPILILLLVIFLIVLISSYNFITIFFGIVGFSLNIYVLILNDGFNYGSREAGIKYFYLSMLSSGLLLCGIFLIYLSFSTTSFLSVNWLLHHWAGHQYLDNQNILFRIITYFIVFGFLFKLAAFPGHLWAPEVYDGSPNIVTVLFVLPIKIAMFALFIRVLNQTFSDLYPYWQNLLWISAFFSMFWGCFGALVEQNIKRFMAYSSINQMGFLLMGLNCGNFQGVKAALIYLLLYVIMNAGFFLFFLTTHEQNSNRNLTYLTDFNLFGISNYLYTIGLVIILFSMAGIPPLGGFFGKYFIFLHNFEIGDFGLVLMGMFTSIIGTYYYLRIIKILWFERRKLWTYKNKVILIFETNLVGNLLEIYVFLKFILIFFIVWSRFTFQTVNIITQIGLRPFVLI